MAYPTNYADWVDYITDFLDIEDLKNSKIESFLSLSQTRLNRELNSQWMEKDVPLIVETLGLPIPIIPSAPDYNRVRLVVSDENPEPLDVLAFNEFVKLTASDASGMPTNYAIEGQKLYMYPYPSEGSGVTLYYYAQVPEISTSQQSNVFTDHHPDILIYGSCLAGSLFIVEDERVPTWEKAYEITLDSINGVAKNSKLGSTPLKRNITLYRVK